MALRRIPEEWARVVVRELTSVGFEGDDISRVTGLAPSKVAEHIEKFGGVEAFPDRPKDRYGILLKFVKSAAENFATVHVEDPELRDQILRYRAELMVSVLELDTLVAMSKEDLIKIFEKLPEFLKLQEKLVKSFLEYQNSMKESVDKMKGPIEEIKKFFENLMK